MMSAGLCTILAGDDPDIVEMRAHMPEPTRVAGWEWRVIKPRRETNFWLSTYGLEEFPRVREALEFVVFERVLVCGPGWSAYAWQHSESELVYW